MKTLPAILLALVSLLPSADAVGVIQGSETINSNITVNGATAVLSGVTVSNNAGPVLITTMPGGSAFPHWQIWSNGTEVAEVNPYGHFKAESGDLTDVSFGAFGNPSNGFYFPSSNRVAFVNGGVLVAEFSNGTFYAYSPPAFNNTSLTNPAGQTIDAAIIASNQASGQATTNYTIAATNTLLTNMLSGPTIYVRTNGNDTTAVIGDITHPFANYVPAIHCALTNSASRVYFFAGTYLPTGSGPSGGTLNLSNAITLEGESENLVWLTGINSGGIPKTIILSNNNIVIRHLHIGSNLNNGTLWRAPIIPASGTNILIENCILDGDSDIIDNPAVNVPWTNVVIRNNTFNNGYDSIDMYQTNANAGGSIYGNTFNFPQDPGFAAPVMFAIEPGGGTWNIFGNVFNGTNSISNGLAAVCLSHTTNATVNLGPNIYNLFNTVVPTNTFPVIMLANSSLHVLSALPTNGVSCQGGGIVHYPTARFANVVASGISADTAMLLGTNITALMLGDWVSNSAHLHGVPTVQLDQGANSALSIPGGSGLLLLPGYCDYGGNLILTNGSSTGPNISGYVFFTNTFAHPFLNPPSVSVMTITNGSLVGSSFIRFFSSYIAVSVSTTNFILEGNGSNLPLAAGSTFGLSITVQGE